MKEGRKDYTRYLNVNEFSNNIFTKQKYKKQRAKWGFCSYDAMDIDCWFLYVMPRMIEYLRNNHMGFPTFLMEEYYKQNKERTDMTEEEFFACIPNEPKEREEFKENAEKYCNDRWNEILDRMIFLFDECDDEKCSLHNEFDLKTDSKNYYKRQDEIEKHQEKCKKEALKMFVKYFDNLWN